MFETIWLWTKRAVLILLGIGAAIFAIMGLRSKEKPKGDRIKELEAIENKTEADRKELERLEKEKNEAVNRIEDTAEKYKEKIKENENKPEEPGDAGKSHDDLRDSW